MIRKRAEQHFSPYTSKNGYHPKGQRSEWLEIPRINNNYYLCNPIKLQDIGEDMVVLYEDQQKINLFAKKNSLLNDIKDQITEKEVTLYNNSYFIVLHS